MLESNAPPRDPAHAALSPEQLRERDAWNDTAAPYPDRATLAELFFAQAARTPDALAYIQGDESLTYRVLADRALRLGHRLRALGTGPDCVVGVFLPRSLEAVVALLGVLAAGGAFLPLDTGYPSERLRYMLADAGARTVLSLASLGARLDGGDAQVLYLDTDPALTATAAEPPPPLHSGAGPDHLAYLMYTSGSTGVPKGVLGLHRGTVNRLHWMWSAYPLAPGELCCQKTALSFGDSIWELFGPLLIGTPTVVLPDAESREPRRLIAALSRHGVTRLVLVPSLLAAMLDSEPDLGARLPRLNLTISSGEALPAELARRFTAAAPRCRLLNLYGSTEVAADVTCFEVPHGPLETVPIGRPLSNTTAYVLDGAMQLVPPGGEGELYIGGVNLARGYHHRPELTTQRFVPDPFAAAPDARLFRTGDRVRRLPSGDLECLGRMDRQIKLRGFRVELGEVEAALAAHPGVSLAAVTLREDAALGRYLAGYVTARPRHVLDATELRTFLRERLPDYMIPAALSLLPELPLLPSGKVDRQALPEPARAALSRELSPPQTPAEAAVARAFALSLRLPAIGRDEDFFTLGGHSLLAAQAIAHIRAELGVEPPLALLFEHPTPALLAAALGPRPGAGEPQVPVLPELPGLPGLPGIQGLHDLPGLPLAPGAALPPPQALPPLRPVPRDRPLPLSTFQEQVWLIAQLDPASPLYSDPYTLRIRGPLHVPALRRALADLLARHEVLRTTYAVVAGAPVQVIRPPGPLPLTEHDLTALSPAEAESRARALARAALVQPFDLGEGPLLRLVLAHLPAPGSGAAPGPGEDHRLYLALHHSIYDAVGLYGTLLPELAALYEAHAAQRRPSLPAPGVQYADFAVWQRRHLPDEALAPQLGYWREQLAGLPPLQLPTDHPRPAGGGFAGERHYVTLPRALRDAVVALAQRAGVTLHMALLAAFQALLYRYSGQRDFAIATVASSRHGSDSAGISGFFANTLVLRAKIAGDLRFRELLSRVRAVALSAYAHKDVPFQRVVAELRPERSLGRNPLFQTMLLLDPPQPVLPPGWSTTRLDIHSGTAMCDLSLQLAEVDGTLRGFFEYSTDLFRPDTIARLAGHFETLLAGAAADPDRTVAALPLLGTEEAARLRAFGTALGSFPVEPGLPAEFVAAARARPDAVAVTHEGVHLTYGELLARASALAHALQAAGVGPDTLVALLLERSPELVIAIVGTALAGGAYVPIDPVSPRDRVAFLLSDSAPAVLVTQPHLRERLPGFSGPVVALDLAEPVAPVAPPVSRALPAHLLYVIYTSGSTGRPKGVQVTRANAARLFTATQGWFHFDARDVWTLFHSYAFDFSVWELWGALRSGGRLVVVPHWITRSPEALYKLLADEQVTVLNQTPSSFGQLMQVDAAPETAQAPEARAALALRLVIFGGEALDVPGLLPWFRRHGDVRPRLVNMYGITETTVHVTYRPLTQDDCAAPGSVIGEPIPDLSLRVLDADGNVVPIGVPGELYVGGAGLSRGYLRRPELDAARFPVGLAGGPGERLYRTGDLVRYLASGDLEYLGRIDQQVKIRGFRIELGEIEEVLRQQPGVHAAVVLAREDTPGDRRLIGYLAADAETEDAQAALAQAAREHARRLLPEYMVPARVVVLRSLPLTDNGKVDRRALPAPELMRALPPGQRQPPRNFVEEELARVFAEVLGVPGVGVTDNFFELGGHSLLITRVIFAIRDAFHIELPMRALFEAPTVAELARRIQALPRRERGLLIPPIRPGTRAARRPTSFAQRRLWFLAQLDPQDYAYNEPLTLTFPGALDVAALERALCEVTRRHEIWRTALVSEGGEPVQVVVPELPVTLPQLDLRAVPAESREAAVLHAAQADAQRPFDLTQAPLWRALLLRVADDEHRLFLTLHHVMADGLSIYGVLLVELDALYRAFSAGEPSPLPELPVQFADYAAWQRAWLGPEVLRPQLDYWISHLGRDVSELRLHTDRPRPLTQAQRGGRRVVRIPPELMRRLRTLGHREGATLFIVLLAAWKALLYRYVPQPDVVIGIVTASRQRPELAPLFGFFPNTLALRTQLDGGLPFRALLARVREACIGAYDHQELPFDLLVEALKPKRSVGETPLFRAAFVLDPPLPETSGTFRVGFVDIEIESAKFDLHMELVETPEGLLGHLGYSADLFDAATIDRMLAHYQALLESAAAEPDRPIAELPMLTPDDAALLRGFQGGADDAGDAGDVGVHRLFEAQAARRPDALAVWSEDECLSYGELDARAERLAQRLRGIGVGPDALVGVCIERSPELIVALLGVLKAGGAFLPLDAGQPAARIAFQLEDARVCAVVTREQLRARLPETRAEIVTIDGPEPPGRPPRAAGPVAQVAPHHLAYVIYTSGSTGRPKGVLIEHRGIVSTVQATRAAWQLDESGRVLQFASLHFDASVWEILTALCAGAALCLCPKVPPLGAALARFIERCQASVVMLTPTAMATLPDEGLSSVRTLVAGGEACPAELVARLGRGRRFLNAYGPTEISICATISVCDASGGGGAPAIGRPLPGARVYLLDEQRRQVPVGVAGEIYIGGRGAARGYLNRPELSSSRFLPDPFSDVPGARMYRTGDLARYRSDGELMFLGRADDQVKLRGFRIELGEIEAALAAAPGVRQCAVAVREDVPDQRELAAYVVRADGDGAVQVAALREHLKARLPHYMVPATFTFVDALPLGPTGKVDRRALPAPDPASRAAVSAYVAPESELEQRIAAVWCEVLQVARVGRSDNFFDLGGHSLRLAQVQARLGAVLGRELPLVELFQHPTVSALARRLAAVTAPQGPGRTDGDGDGGLSSDQDRGKRQREALLHRRQQARPNRRQDEQ